MFFQGLALYKAMVSVPLWHYLSVGYLPVVKTSQILKTHESEQNPPGTLCLEWLICPNGIWLFFLDWHPFYKFTENNSSSVFVTRPERSHHFQRLGWVRIESVSSPNIQCKCLIEFNFWHFSLKLSQIFYWVTVFVFADNNPFRTMYLWSEINALQAVQILFLLAQLIIQVFMVCPAIASAVIQALFRLCSNH